MVRHIVSWNFKPELTEEQRQAVREEIVPRINALKELVPWRPGGEGQLPASGQQQLRPGPLLRGRPGR